MKYTLLMHGDLLEKTFVKFIKDHIPTYEHVWQNYIGNDSQNKIANIMGYDKEKNEKRQRFSEHTYTILQSIILIKRVLEKYNDGNKTITDIEDVLDFQDTLILFFGNIGRIYDNLYAAESCLNARASRNCRQTLSELYHKRHLLVHGKTIPFIIDEEGQVLIPKLGRNTDDLTGWYHKTNTWQDLKELPTDTVATTLNEIYQELLSKLNNIFGKFNDDILSELAVGNFKIDPPSQYFSNLNSINFEVSGAVNIGNFSSSGNGKIPDERSQSH